MSFLKFVGSALLGIVSSYLIWLLFYFATPWVMSFGWMGFALLCVFDVLFIGLFIGACSIISYPLLSLIADKKSKFIPIAAMILFGISSSALPWRMDIDYDFVKILLALSLSVTAAIIFFSIIAAIYSSEQ